MKVQKIVSLDVETAQIAQDMPNFSLFVRNQLHATKSEESWTDIQNRVAIFNKALKLACQDFALYRIDMGANLDDSGMTQYKEYIDKAKQELFQSKLGDY